MSNDAGSKVKWRCRRGMLELDTMLNAYFDQCYSDLSSEDQRLFESLLALEDQQLYRWLLATDDVVDDPFVALVQSIRNL